jgi:hypothetical protein
LSYSTAFLQLLFVVVFTGFWLLHGAEPVQRDFCVSLRKL